MSPQRHVTELALRRLQQPHAGFGLRRATALRLQAAIGRASGTPYDPSQFLRRAAEPGCANEKAAAGCR
jgi:hypothetical protein